MAIELSLFQEAYAYLSVILVVFTFLVVWVKKDNALFALSIASGVLALTVLVSPFNDYVAGAFNIRIAGQWRHYEITAIQLKMVITVTVILGVLAINGFFRRLGIKHPYGKMKDDNDIGGE